jgi:two-component sensor histidine kinase
MDENLEIVSEFIRITGREVKDKEVFAKLKNRPKLILIFDELL